MSTKKIEAKKETLSPRARGYFTTLMTLPPEERLALGTLAIEPDNGCGCVVGRLLAGYRGMEVGGELPSLQSPEHVDLWCTLYDHALEEGIRILPNSVADWYSLYWGASCSPGEVEIAFAASLDLAIEGI